MDQSSQAMSAGTRGASEQVSLWRRLLVWGLLVTCLAWPIWSAWTYRQFLMQAQQPYEQAMNGWRHLEQRFMPVCQTLRPGTVLEYAPSKRIYVRASRVNDVQFVISPIILRRHAHVPLSSLILADKLNDDELAQYVEVHGLEVVHAWGGGLAVLRKPAKESRP